MSGTSTPPGWYPVPDAPGWQRWWDGSQWTEATMPPGAGPTRTPPASGPDSPTPPSSGRRWPLLAAGGVGLLLIVVAVVVVGIRWLSPDEVIGTPPGSDDVTQPTSPANSGTPTDGIPVAGDLGDARVDALLPADHNERGRQVLNDREMLVLSHPAFGQYVTISLLRAADGAVSVVDRQQLQCSYDEEIVGASGGARLEPGDGLGYVTCEGLVDSAIMDAEMAVATRVWALEPDGSSLVAHPDPEQGWPTVGFQLRSGPGGQELVLPVCTDRDCSPEQYTYAVHVAQDSTSQRFEAVACSEPSGPRTEMPGGPWDASGNPELIPPAADRGCGPERYVRPTPTIADVEPRVVEVCDLLGEMAASEPGSTAERDLLVEIDTARFDALAVGVLSTDELHDLVGDTCPQHRQLWELLLDALGYR